MKNEMKSEEDMNTKSFLLEKKTTEPWKILKLCHMAFVRSLSFHWGRSCFPTIFVCLFCSFSFFHRVIAKGNLKRRRYISFTSHPNGIKDSLNLMKIYKLHRLMHVMLAFLFFRKDFRDKLLLTMLLSDMNTLQTEFKSLYVYMFSSITKPHV